MKFPYRKVGDYWMPVIHIGLQRKDVRIFAEALVDSGSSWELPVNSINILGQHGFFELFPVRFLQSRSEIDIFLRSKYAQRR